MGGEIFTDAQLEKRRALAELAKQKISASSPVIEAKGPIRPGSPSGPKHRLTKVLLTTGGSRKVPQMLTA